ncbi:hypothetical protein NFI96_020768 [Prochilodus magdalenae]|nr:hypothetical protein NFI96_020768 [Prochilodus magdalenae]
MNDCTSVEPSVKNVKFTDDTTVIGLIRDHDKSAYRRKDDQTEDGTITKDLKWDCNISLIIKKAQQRMYFLRQLRKFNLSQELMIQFYTSTMESVITTSITVWGSSGTKQDTHRLQRIISSAEKTTGVKLLTLLDLHTSRTRRHADKIITDPSHPSHHLFLRLPTVWHFSQMRIKTTRLQRSFFPHAITLTNS